MMINTASLTSKKSSWLLNLRLPTWLLPNTWPMNGITPQLANIEVVDGVISRLLPVGKKELLKGKDLGGNLCLPKLLEAHSHLDKTYTRYRIGQLKPGLLGAIEAMQSDKTLWSYDDLYERGELALKQAYSNGVKHLRTHIDWGNEHPPLAWKVIADLALNWKAKIHIEMVALISLDKLSNIQNQNIIIDHVRQTKSAIMGCFIHSSNFDNDIFNVLIKHASDLKIDLDLHIDEELTEKPLGLMCLLDCLESITFNGKIICGHACALSSCDNELASSLLDRIAKQPITLISLPATNLLLQDSEIGRTPRLLGLTLLQEAKTRGIPVLIATDNVQDAFCSFGQYDPVEALRLAAYSAQLSAVFDVWSQSICNSNYLKKESTSFSLIGMPADFVLFDTQNVWSWPSGEKRILIQSGNINPINDENNVFNNKGNFNE